MKRRIISFLAGAVIAGALGFTSVGRAACQGYCADRKPGGWQFAGCTLYLDASGDVTGADCFYVKVEVLPP